MNKLKSWQKFKKWGNHVRNFKRKERHFFILRIWNALLLAQANIDKKMPPPTRDISLR